MALRQALAASATATSNAPPAMRRSPPAVPTTRAGTPDRRGATAHLGGPFGVDAHHDDRRRLAEARFRRSATVERQVDTRADLAGDRHLGERDREPAVAHVVHAVHRAFTDELGDEPVQRRGAFEIRPPAGRRRRARAPPPPTPSRRARAQRRRARSLGRRRAARPPAERPSSSSISPSTPTTGVGWMSSPLDSL